MAKNVTAYVPQQAGQGDAYISKPIDTSGVYDFGLREQARVDKEAAAKAQALKDQQDMYVESMMDVPDKINEDFKTPLTQEAMGIAKDKMSLISSGTANYQNTKEINERISNLAIKNAQADKQINHFKLAKEEIKGMTDPWYLSTEAGSDLNSVYAISTNEGLHNHMDQGVDEIREEMHGGKYYNSRGAGQSWAEEMEEFVNADFTKYSKESNAKGFKDASETYSGLTKFKPNGKMDVDEEGRPKVDYDKLKDYLPDWLKYAENENWVRKEQAKYKEGEAPTAEDLFIQQVAPFFSVSYDKKLSGNVKTDDSGDGEDTPVQNMNFMAEAIAKLGSGKKTSWHEAITGSKFGEKYFPANPDVNKQEVLDAARDGMIEIKTQLVNSNLIVDEESSYFKDGKLHIEGEDKFGTKPFELEVDLTSPKSKEELFNLLQYGKTKGKKINPTSADLKNVLPNEYVKTEINPVAKSNLDAQLEKNDKTSLTKYLKGIGTVESSWGSPQKISFKHKGESEVFHIEGSDGWKKLSDSEREENTEKYNHLVGEISAKKNIETDPEEFFK